MTQDTVFLTEPEAMSLLTEYGIPFPRSEVTRSPDEAEKAAERCGEPLVLKVISSAIQHKSDVGGVRLGVSRSEVRTAYDDLVETVAGACPDATIDGVLVQSQVPAGIEVILGIKRDRHFGHVLLFGAGGVLTELLDEVSIRLVPVREAGARAMIEETKLHRLLHGLRGRPPADVSAVVGLLASLSRVAEEHPEIVELDLNPVLVHAQGATAVDALIEIDRRPSEGDERRRDV